MQRGKDQPKFTDEACELMYSTSHDARQACAVVAAEAVLLRGRRQVRIAVPTPATRIHVQRWWK